MFGLTAGRCYTAYDLTRWKSSLDLYMVLYKEIVMRYRVCFSNTFLEILDSSINDLLPPPPKKKSLINYRLDDDMP